MVDSRNRHVLLVELLGGLAVDNINNFFGGDGTEDLILLTDLLLDGEFTDGLEGSGKLLGLGLLRLLGLFGRLSLGADLLESLGRGDLGQTLRKEEVPVVAVQHGNEIAGLAEAWRKRTPG